MNPELNTYFNLHILAHLLVRSWGKRVAIKRASELCDLPDESGAGKVGDHFREFNIMREYIQQQF